MTTAMAMTENVHEKVWRLTTVILGRKRCVGRSQPELHSVFHNTLEYSLRYLNHTQPSICKKSRPPQSIVSMRLCLITSCFLFFDAGSRVLAME